MKHACLHLTLWLVSLAQVPPRSVSYEILPTLAPGQDVGVMDRYSHDPYIEINSPLYRSILDRDRKCVVWSQFTVRAEDCEDEYETDRRWWSHRELMDYALEDADYRASGGYDRGHLRSLAMSRGSEHWQCTNHLAGNIIPELGSMNRGPIQQLEAHICELATEHGFCIVTITMTFDDDWDQLPNADERHDIPTTISYLIQSPAGEERESFDNE